MKRNGGKKIFAFALHILEVFDISDLGNILPFSFFGLRTSIIGIEFQWSGPFLLTEVLEPRPRTNKDFVQLDRHHEESSHANDNTPFPGYE